MRMTRAALRAQESCDMPSSEHVLQLKKSELLDSEPLIHEDSDPEISELDKSDAKITDQEDGLRLALRDITSENYPTPCTDSAATEANQGKKTRKGKGGRPKKKTMAQQLQDDDVFSDQQNGAESATEPTILSQEDENTAAEMSNIADMLVTASREIDAGPTLPDQMDEQLNVSNTLDELMEGQYTAETEEANEIKRPDEHVDGSPRPHPEIYSDEAQATPRHDEQNKAAKTPKFDPEFHATINTNGEGEKDLSEDSFVGSIKTRSPSKLAQSQHEEQEPDSFVGDIIVRTPSKKLAHQRVEDSVTALDALEDAIEQFSETLPMIVDSPIKQQKTPAKVNTPVREAKSITPQSKRKQSLPMPTQKLTSPNTPNSSKEKVLPKSIVKERVKEFESKPVATAHRRATSVSIAKRTVLTAPSMAPKSKHVPTKSVPTVSNTNGMSCSKSPAKADPDLVKKRITSGPLSTSKPAFIPAKSEKPVTKSSFVLPGEAIAAKLKAQREERAKREEAAAEMKSQVKTKPATSKLSRPSVMPRENKASQARMSMMAKGSGDNKENVAPPRPAIRPNAATVTIPKKRQDTVPANTSARRTTTIAPPVTTMAKQRAVSTTSSQRVTSSSSSAGTSTQKGKEVFDRQRTNREAELKEKREKEAAAKRARAEAAGRGRQASREWAEKQKRRVMEKVAATVEVKSVSA